MNMLKPIISHPGAVDIPLVDFNHPSVMAVLGSNLQAAGLLCIDVLECEGLEARDSAGGAVQASRSRAANSPPGHLTAPWQNQDGNLR
jgi:hypothetical protein